MKRTSKALGISYEVPPTPVYPAKELYKAIPNREFEVFNMTVDTTLETRTILSATYPCTIVQYKLEATAHCIAATADVQNWFWALLLVKDGYNANTPTIADTNNFYKPEQNVITWGKGLGMGVTNDYYPPTKISRSEKCNLRLQAGDTIQLIALGTNANAIVDFYGAVEYIQVTAHQ